jgi:threonylcarbamoyladenosine tRNA methylthiotransferase MtaB
MRRLYSTSDYQRAVSLIRKEIPDAAITIDIIAGFPGETEAEFEESYQFCQQMKFARIHVFAYSSRPGTSAATMCAQVSSETKRKRSQKLLALAKESSKNFREQFSGRSIDVLWEQKIKSVRPER